MPRKTKSKQTEYELLSIEVNDFNAHVDAAINYEVFDKRYAYDDTPIYRFHNDIEIIGECDYPEERANCFYTINITSNGNNSSKFHSQLKDFHEQDDNYQPKYRKRKGELIPIYNPPKGIGYIEKRGGNNWYCYVSVTPQTITDMITLLSSHVRPLYLAIHEAKEGRRRIIRGITLQMKHPGYE